MCQTSESILNTLIIKKLSIFSYDRSFQKLTSFVSKFSEKQDDFQKSCFFLQYCLPEEVPVANEWKEGGLRQSRTKDLKVPVGIGLSNWSKTMEAKIDSEKGEGSLVLGLRLLCS